MSDLVTLDEAEEFVKAGAVLQHRRRYWLDDRQFEALRAPIGGDDQ